MTLLPAHPVDVVAERDSLGVETTDVLPLFPVEITLAITSGKP